MRAPAYLKEKGYIPDDLSSLLSQLDAEWGNVRDACKIIVPISRGSLSCGFGIRKSDKDIAVDKVIAILKQIRNVKGW